MKKNLTLFFLLLGFAFGGGAQNAHWGYMHPTYKPSSAVTVIHSNGTGYLFYADNRNLYVSEIDPVTLQPLGTDYESSGLWSLQGAYEDFNGDIVVYGSYNNLPWAGLYEIANHTIQYAAQLSSYPGDYFVNGCCGYDVNGNMVNMFVLENQNFVAAFTDQLSPTNTPPNTDISHVISGYDSRATDVDWDSFNERFVLCGKRYAGDQIGLFVCQYTFSAPYFNVFSFNCWEYSSSPPYFDYKHAESRPSLEILDDHTIVLGSPLRTPDKGDGIVLSLIDNYSTITNSSLFLFQATKLFLHDLKYIPERNLLTLLGKIDYYWDIHYIAQVNPYALSGMDAAYITGNVPTTACSGEFLPNLYSNNIQLQKLELNPSRSIPTILSTGTYNGTEVYVTETANISQSVCDITWSPTDVTLYDTPLSANLFQSTESVGQQTHSFAPTNTPLLIKECYDYVYDRLNAPDSVKSLSIIDEEYSPFISTISDNRFVCGHFSGTINYKLYDLSGKLICAGTTGNNQIVSFHCGKGVYCLRVSDDFGNWMTKKIVVL